MLQSAGKRLDILHPSDRLAAWGAGVGKAAFLAACLGLGLIELGFGEPLPQLHPWGEAAAPVAYASGASLAIIALWLMIRPIARWAAFALAAHWAVALCSTLAAATREPSDPLIWVPVAETAVFVLASLTVTSTPGASRRTVLATGLRLGFAVMLLMFGLVHFALNEAIAGLIPSWIPGAEKWPWVTGSIMIGAGVALLAGRGVEPAGAVIAAMFASWLFLVHAGRVAGVPASSFEWTFALTAVGLAGVALMVASSGSLSSGTIRKV